MGNAGFDNGQMQGARGQHALLVVAEQPLAGDLGHAGGTRGARTEHVAVGRHVVVDAKGHFAAQHLGGVHDGVDQGDVAGATANVFVLLEPIAHLFAGGLGIAVQKALGGHDEARGAKAALGRAVDDPGGLQRVQVGRGADAFDGGHVGVVGDAADLGDAGAGDLAVDDDRAGAALALGAAHLGAGHVQLVAQHVGQEGIRVGDDFALDPVNDKNFFLHVVSLRFGWRFVALPTPRPEPIPVRAAFDPWPGPIPCRSRRRDSGIRDTWRKGRRAPVPRCRPGSDARRPQGAARSGRRCWPCGT